jgi:hypothetical protein
VTTSEATLAAGQTVRTVGGVRPPRYANRVGLVVAVGRDEISVRFGSRDSHSQAVAFRRRELKLVEPGERPPEAPTSPSNPISGGWEPVGRK